MNEALWKATSLIMSSSNSDSFSYLITMNWTRKLYHHILNSKATSVLCRFGVFFNSFCLVFVLLIVCSLLLSSVCTSSAVPFAIYFPTLRDYIIGLFQGSRWKHRQEILNLPMMSTLYFWESNFIFNVLFIKLFSIKHHTLLLRLDRSIVEVVADFGYSLYL